MNAMKKLFLLMIICPSFMFTLFTQEINSSYWPNQPEIVCYLHGQTMHMLTESNPTGPEQFCSGDYDFYHTQWFSFVADTTFLTFHFEVIDSLPGMGCHLQVMRAIDENCLDFEPISDCYAEEQDGALVELEDLEKGMEYFVVVDGHQDDVCSFYFTVEEGNVRRPLPESIPYLDGPGSIANGQSGEFELKFEKNPDYPGYCGIDTCGQCIPDSLEIHWTAPDDVEFIDISDDGYTAEVIWGNTPGEICIHLDNGCVKSKVCKFVAVKMELWDFYCELDGFYSFCGNYYYEPGTYICEEVDSETGEIVYIHELELYMEPQEVRTVQETICAGQVYTSEDQTFTQSGNYSYYVEEGGMCPVRIDLSLTVLPPEREEISVQLCAGESYHYDYQHNFTAPGIFNFIVTDNEGCHKEVELELVSPEFNLAINSSGDVLKCCTPTQTLTASCDIDAAFSWTLPDGSVSSDFQIESSIPGEYLLTAHHEGCLEEVSTTLEHAFNYPEVVINGRDLRCDEREITLTTDLISQYEPDYQWTDSNGQPVGTDSELAVDQPGIYQLKATDPQSCCDYSTQIEVISHIGPGPEFDLSLRLNCDQEGTAFIEVIPDLKEGPVSIEWSNGSTETETLLHSDGLVGILLTDTFGCKREHLEEVILPRPVDLQLPPYLGVEAETPLEFDPLAFTNYEDVIQFQWRLENSGYTGKDMVEVSELIVSDMLEVLWVDKWGCSYEEYIEIKVYQHADQIYLPTAFSPNSDGINDELRVFFPDGLKMQRVEWLIYNRWGQMVRSSRLAGVVEPFNIWDGTIDGEPAPTGSYFLELRWDTPENNSLKRLHGLNVIR